MDRSWTCAGRWLSLLRAALGGGTRPYGYTRISIDGRVEVYAVGSVERLSKLAGMLHRGPQWSDVRGVEEQEAAIQDYGTFRIA